MTPYASPPYFTYTPKGGSTIRVLVACEFSGIVREAFKSFGHDAWSCDLLPTELEGNHIQDDVLKHLNDGWDLMIAHPPCTYLTVSGNRWMDPQYSKRFPDRHQRREEALRFFITLAEAPIEHIAIENPVGIVSTCYRKPDQYIEPYQFGHPTTKKTGLWLKNLPPLKPTKIVTPEYYTYKDGRHDSLLHFNTIGLPPAERSKARSRTFSGIAYAMASQWGSICDPPRKVTLSSWK